MIYVIRDARLKSDDANCFLTKYDTAISAGSDELRRVIRFGQVEDAIRFFTLKEAVEKIQDIRANNKQDWPGLMVETLLDARVYSERARAARRDTLSFEDEEDTAEEKTEEAGLAYQSFIDSLSEVKEDVVNHPAHYENDKYQCIDVMEDIYGTEAVMNFCMCNAFKYIWRFQKKNGIEDIQKAQWYMNKYQELAENLTKEAGE